jgi:BMFP domain-containing protein YqiC
MGGSKGVYRGLTMQTRNPFLDEIGKAMESAIGVAQAAGEEARAAVRAQADHWASELDLVRRDEFDALKERLEGEIAALKAEIASLAQGGVKTPPAGDAG